MRTRSIQTDVNRTQTNVYLLGSKKQSHLLKKNRSNRNTRWIQTDVNRTKTNVYLLDSKKQSHLPQKIRSNRISLKKKKQSHLL
jgi:hypothetical protein